jgi:hypothetical protein
MSRRGAVALVLFAVLLTGCFTGKRPYFTDEPFPAGTMTGDASIDALLTKLDAVTTGPATAAYSVLTKFGNTTSTAVAILDGGNRSVSIGNVRYIDTPTAQATCAADGSTPCATGLDATKVSDIGITVDFYAADVAKRLRRDFRAMIGPSSPHVETIAEQPVTCVDLPLSGGVAVYCVMENGMVARLDDGDVAVNLTMYGAVADASLFVVPVDA